MAMNRYHKLFLESFTAENIIGVFSRYRGGPKEITESMGMLEAAKKYGPKLNEAIVYVIGDGCSPRTGSIFAYFTKANVNTVDPNFRMDHWTEHCEKQTAMGFPVQRLHLWKDKIENLLFDSEGKDIVVVWPHSHASMNAQFVTNYKSRTDIALPCCVPVPATWMLKPHLIYQDKEIETQKNIVHIWKES